MRGWGGRCCQVPGSCSQPVSQGWGAPPWAPKGAPRQELHLCLGATCTLFFLPAYGKVQLFSHLPGGFGSSRKKGKGAWSPNPAPGHLQDLWGPGTPGGSPPFSTTPTLLHFPPSLHKRKCSPSRTALITPQHLPGVFMSCHKPVPLDSALPSSAGSQSSLSSPWLQESLAAFCLRF